MNMFKKNGGFTLVELIVVIAILAILAGVAVPAYNGYITKAQETAVITELSAIHTAAQAANATAGEIGGIKVSKTGKTIYVTAPTNKKLADDFESNFELFYGKGSCVVAGNEASATVTMSDSSAFVTLTGTSYEHGVEWTSSSGKWTAATTDINDNP